MERAAEMFSLGFEGVIVPYVSGTIDRTGGMKGVVYPGSDQQGSSLTVVVRRVVEQVTSDSISRCGSTGFIAN